MISRWKYLVKESEGEGEQETKGEEGIIIIDSG